MLSTLFSRARRSPQHAAEELMNLLGERASVVVDDRLVAEMGVGRKALYRIIYDMVRRERMFMLSDRYNQMLLMTNAEFNRFMFRRSGKPIPLSMLSTEAEMLCEDSDIVLDLEASDSDIVLEDAPFIPDIPAAPAASTAPAAVAAAFAAAPAPGPLDWFSLDIAPSKRERDAAALTGEAVLVSESAFVAEGLDFPDHRQSLPERKREPWAILEDVVPD